ncbi:single-stranded DNA-binding protein [Candidatus Parcubacteria bacterium]|nr:MAG: single-stranded DNA-binding protein [Candidatus Parcubacteria bacterium]
MNLNKVFLVGRVTADPELRTTPGGQSVTGFGVATNRVWTDKTGKRQEEAEFHNVVAWGRQAEIASQFLKKGSMVLIEGRLRTRTWQDKEGKNRRTTEVICERLQLGPRPAGKDAFSQGDPLQSRGPAQPAPAEDIPIVDLDAEEKASNEDLPF